MATRDWHQFTMLCNAMGVLLESSSVRATRWLLKIEGAYFLLRALDVDIFLVALSEAASLDANVGSTVGVELLTSGHARTTVSRLWSEDIDIFI